jgi:hydrophobic/amphiphilic exporter-1 (mainly G- bacteria), HAE1 family
MNFIRRLIDRPVTVLVLFAGASILGLFALQDTAIAFFPKVEPPVLMVVTDYSAGPEQVEENVTRRLENVLAGLTGLETIRSTSSEGRSRVVMELSWKTDLTEATNDVRDLLDRARGSLPDDAGDPRIFKFDPSSRPIMTIALSGDRSPEDLRILAEDELETQLERVAGVAEVTISGGRNEIVAVDLDRSALQTYGLTVTTVARALDAANRELSGGTVTLDDRSLLIRSTGLYRTLRDIEETVVGYAGGTGTSNSATGANTPVRPVQLSEVGTVRFARDTATTIVHVNGVPAVTLAVTAESDANTVEVAAGVHAALARLSDSIPPGVNLIVTRDDSTAVRDTLDQVTSSLMIGGLLAIAILVFFLHNVRAAIIIGLSIPVSLLVTILAMAAGGVTLNVLSMSGLILGIGMIVDSSIVVLENIDRHRRQGLGIMDAARAGAGEMLTAITASALTTVSVFVPILIFRSDLGIMGILFGDIAFVVIVAILSSLAVAALLIPVMASTWLPLHGYGDDRQSLLRRAGNLIEKGLDRLESGYARLLRTALRHRALVLALVTAMLIVVLSFVPRLGFIFSPPTAEDSVLLTIELREGTPAERTDRIANDLAAWIGREFPAAETIVVQSGGDTDYRATIEIGFSSIRTAAADRSALEAAIRRETARRPDGISLNFGRDRSRQLSGGDPIDIMVQSDDLAALASVAVEIRDLLEREFPEVTEPSTDLGAAAPELLIRIDPLRAAEHGITASQVTSEIRAAVDGFTATRYARSGQEWDVRVALMESLRRDIADLESIVLSGGSHTVTVGDVASITLGQSPTVIQREEEVRTIHVTGGLAGGAIVSEVQPRIQQAIEDGLDIPVNVDVTFSGEMSEFSRTVEQVGIVFLIAVLLVFGIMASQFESFRMPFIIFFTIPLMLIGSVGIYVLMGQPISIFALLGLVVLAGIVVNNGIVLVDYTNLLRTRGRDLGDAVIEAGRTRFKPILMTTLTTILGMVPLAFFPGEGGQLTQPVGITVVGGLASSAVLTLFVVPVLYSIFSPRAGVRKQDEVHERIDTGGRG